MHRAYVLAVEERSGNKKIDRFVEAASQLYAFSTQTETTLPGAPGTSVEGLLAGANELKPESNKLGASLLEPVGITVEPISASVDNIIIAGSDDTGTKTEKGVPIWDTTLEWVTSTGGVTGRKWVDSTGALGDAAESPVYLPSKGLAIEDAGSLYTIPWSGPPSLLAGTVTGEQEFLASEDNFLVPSPTGPLYGDSLAASPEGVLWSDASIRLAETGEFYFPGALSSDSQGNVIGWTGAEPRRRTKGSVPSDSRLRRCSPRGAVNESSCSIRHRKLRGLSSSGRAARRVQRRRWGLLRRSSTVRTPKAHSRSGRPSRFVQR